MGPPIGQALEFLTAVLTQRGPQAVPYDEKSKWTIREHLSDLLKMFPNLAVKVNEFHTNDGRILHLLKAEGTIPIHYQAHKYNIPIVVWLPERYPLQGPIVYVSPTPNMIIKTGHSFVDASGLVRSPCITHWLYPSSDLSSTCQEMAMLFGAEPPLYSKPPGYVAPNTAAPGQGPSSNPYAGYAQQPQQQMQPPPSMQQQQPYGAYPNAAVAAQQQADPNLASHSIWGAAYAAATAGGMRPPDAAAAAAAAAAGAATGPGSGLGYGVQQTPPPPPPPVDPKQQQTDELKSNFQGLASRALAGRLQAGLEAYNRHATEEMDQLLEVQHKLIAREQQLQAIVSSIQQERVGTEGLVAQLGKQSGALEAWLSSHEWKADAVNATAQGGSSGIDVSKVIVPADDLSRQALAAQAEDMAVEDCLLVLEKAMLQGKIEPDVYLKQVRLMCRKQFLARALGLKVAQAQRQQPQPRASGSHGPAFTLTHGDTWSHR